MVSLSDLISEHKCQMLMIGVLDVCPEETQDEALVGVGGEAKTDKTSSDA